MTTPLLSLKERGLRNRPIAEIVLTIAPTLLVFGPTPQSAEFPTDTVIRLGT